MEDLEVSAEGGVAVNGLSLAVHRGEIVGVAGVVGNGQEEFVRAISGQIPVGAGRVVLDGRDVTRWSIGQRRAAGLASIPEDRDREGLIPPFALQENLILGDQGRYAGLAGLRMKTVEAHSRDLMRRFDIRSTGPSQVATHLSGGNRQKVVVARELSRGPVIVLAVGPTCGLDLRAAGFVREQLQAVRARGDAVLLVSTDLEELMALCDRIAVIYRGRITGMLGRNAFSEEALGRMMTGAA